MAGQNRFLPAPSDAFSVISMQTRNMSGIFIQNGPFHLISAAPY